MIRHSWIFAAVILSSPTAPALAQTSVLLRLQVDGKPRAALLRVPKGVEKPPVVFYIHGATDSGGWFQKMGNADATADREKYIAIYACASADCGSGIWSDMQGTSNFPYLFAVLDSVDARYRIDRSRVYMTGFSQGGFIAFAAACNYSDVFAAVAPESGHVNMNATCDLKRPVPILLTWGASEGSASFLKDRDYWLKLDKCPTTGTMTKPYPASNPNSKAVRVAYGPCEGNTQVIIDSIVGQGHRWPSMSNLNQADEVWAFFKQYSLDKATNVRPKASARSGASDASITIAYASGMIYVGGMRGEARVEVTDTRGRLITAANTRQSRLAFKGGYRGICLVSVRGSGVAARKILILP